MPSISTAVPVGLLGFEIRIARVSGESSEAVLRAERPAFRHGSEFADASRLPLRRRTCTWHTRLQDDDIIVIVHISVDENLDSFIGAVREEHLVFGDTEVRGQFALGLDVLGVNCKPALLRRSFRNVVTCGEHPIVFSLKSRRSLSSRPPDGGEYGAISMTASRGRSLLSLLVATIRTSTDLACASRPSALASVVTAGASRRERLRAELLRRDHFDVIGSRESAAQARRSRVGST